MGPATLQVKHLEVSSASMAEDLCRKSAIIETYVMDSRIGQCPVPSPQPGSSPSPAPSFPAIQSCGFSPLLEELDRVPDETAGRGGRTG